MATEKSATHREGPLYCPHCGHGADETGGSPLCVRCGATLRLQGYCPICESHLRLDVGELCPKHDVKLVADDLDARVRLKYGSPLAWVAVKRFPHSLAAAAARIRLEAEGIPTFLDGERMGSPSMYRVATGGVKLLVPAEFRSDARVILDQDWSWPVDELGGDDGSWDDGEEIAAESESPRVWLAEAIIALVVVIPLAMWLLIHLGSPR
jgi:hypothetical protein